MLIFGKGGALDFSRLEEGDEFTYIRGGLPYALSIRPFKVDRVGVENIICTNTRNGECARFIRSSLVKNCFAPGDPVLKEVESITLNRDRINRIGDLVGKMNPSRVNPAGLASVEQLLNEILREQGLRPEPVSVRSLILSGEAA